MTPLRRARGSGKGTNQDIETIAEGRFDIMMSPAHHIMTFSAMSYFASEMNLPLNDAISLALREWLTASGFEGLPVDSGFDVCGIQH